MNTTLPPQQYAPDRPPGPPPSTGKATASLVLGLCGLFMWLCPLAGLPGTITGLVLGLQARKNQGGATATAGIILCLIGLIASLINAGIGAYLGATGQHELLNAIQESVSTGK